MVISMALETLFLSWGQEDKTHSQMAFLSPPLSQHQHPVSWFLPSFSHPVLLFISQLLLRLLIP